VDRVDYRPATEGVTVDLTLQGVAQLISVGQESDTLFHIENVRGSDFADTLTEDSDDNRLEGRTRSDLLQGDDKQDELHNGAGNDTLQDGPGENNLDKSDSNDLLQGGADFDILYGGQKNDTIDSGSPGSFDGVGYWGDPGAVIVNLSTVTA